MREETNKQAEGKEPPSLNPGGPSLTAIGVTVDERKSMNVVKRYEFERLPRESVKAFTAFQAYLDLGPQRSLAAVAARLGKSKVLMERWSRRYDWSGRVAAHAAHLAAAERALTVFMAKEKVYATLADIARILEVASKLGRLSSGLATENVEHSGKVDVNFRLDVEAAIKKVYGEVIDVAPMEKGEGS